MSYFKASFVTLAARCTTAMSDPERLKCSRAASRFLLFDRYGRLHSERQSKNNHAEVNICSATWRHDCLEDKVVDFSFSCFCCWKAYVCSYTKNSSPIICNIIVRTVCLKPLIWGIKSDFPAVCEFSMGCLKLDWVMTETPCPNNVWCECLEVLHVCVKLCSTYSSSTQLRCVQWRNIFYDHRLFIETLSPWDRVGRNIAQTIQFQAYSGLNRGIGDPSVAHLIYNTL